MSDAVDVDTIEALARLPSLGQPAVSPAGEAIACYYDVTGRNELQVLDVPGDERTQWSDGDVPRDNTWHLAWDPSGERVFFHRDDGGNEQHDVYALSRAGDVAPVVEAAGQNTIDDVGPDGDRLYVGSTREGQMNVYCHDLSTDDVTKVTDYDRAVWTAIVGPNGEHIAYATNETDDFDNRDAYVADADGSNARNLHLGDVGAETMPADWGPDGRRLAVSDNTTDLSRAGIYDRETDEVTWYGDGTFEEYAVALLGADRLVVSRDRDAVTIPVVYDRETGTGREFDLPDGVATVGGQGNSSVQLQDGRVVLTHTTPTRRPSLLAYDLETDETETLIPAEYGPFEPADFADAEYFTVTSDGVPDTPQAAVEHDPAEPREIGALLYDGGERPSPLVVNPHGGPRHRDAKRFNLYTQVLVSRGYSVLQVNYRGSTGRGREFVEALIDDWGGAEQGDIATVAEYALDAYDWLDEDRVVVFGGSYGGYSAYWQLVQYPDLYDAGVAWIGLTDLEDMYEHTMVHYRTELMEKYLGTPDENPDRYRERSPITHAEHLDAPLLMVHGVNDRRVPVSQARRFREALEAAGYTVGDGGDVEYRELGEEGHASSDQEQKLRMFRLLTDFLERRVPAAGGS